jgi:hypothetical protein
MKIQVTKIESGQTIKVARVKTTKEALAYYIERIATGSDWYKDNKAKAEANLAKGIDGDLITTGKHTLEFKVLEVKEYANYTGINEGNRTIGWNDTLLVTDKGTYLVPNRNKVTLVD